MTDINKMAADLANIIPPKDGKWHQGEIRVTTYSVSEGLNRQNVSEKGIPEDTSTTLGHILCLVIMNEGACFGIPKKQFTNQENVVFASCSFMTYSKWCCIFMDAVESFLLSFHNVTLETIQGKKTNEYFLKVSNFILSILRFIHCIAASCDLHVEILPKEFGIVKIADHAKTIADQALKCMNTDDELRSIKEGNHDIKPSSEFAADFELFRSNKPKLTQAIEIMQNSILEKFDNLFDEPNFLQWQLFFKKINEKMTLFTLFFYIIVNNDLPNFAKNLKHLDGFLDIWHFIMNSILLFFRDRKSFEICLKYSEEGRPHLNKILNYFNSLIDTSIQKIPDEFANYFKSKFTEIIEDVRSLLGQFDVMFQELKSSTIQTNNFFIFNTFLILFFL